MSKIASVLIPAHNEQTYLPACLDALLASNAVADKLDVIVIANGCNDGTVDIALGYANRIKDKGWHFTVLDLPQADKTQAWNAGEAAAQGQILIYLDADVLISSQLIAQLIDILSTDQPRFASGLPNVTSGNDWITSNYTRFWHTTPFMVHGTPGFGIFAMNRAGRARWGEWPDIISDDTFARLNFAPNERFSVKAAYDWPMVEGLATLVRVRRRQDIGVAEVEKLFPELLANDDIHDQTRPILNRTIFDPAGAAAFGFVRLCIRLPVFRSRERWARGR